MLQSQRRNFLINKLLSEQAQYSDIAVPQSEAEQKRLLRALMNVRTPKPIGDDFLKVQDEYLQTELGKKDVTDIADLSPVEDNIYLWKGDITTLKCGAIVNAANSGMTGCYQPCHSCIDNCIHTFAGVRLRLECAEIMEKQGYPETTGQAKITSAYNLPCGHVIHTVGPVVQGKLTDEHCRLLKSCYQSCLELAVRNGIDSIAFCCISTGVFGFPKKEAAEIAVRTVRDFLKSHSIKVIFNVFGSEDYEIYKKQLSAN